MVDLWLLRHCAPNFYDAVLCSTQQRISIRRVGHGSYLIAVAAHRSDLFPACRIQNPNAMVTPAARESFSVRREGNRAHPRDGFRHRCDLFTCGSIEDA